ncbi:MAG TPA: hypothetical protein VFZ69_12855 [Longimicrobiales bacterium]
MSEWRLVLGAGAAGEDLPAGGALNMAIDEALLGSAQRDGRPALRFYTWSPACLSLGRNQHARGVFDPARAAAAGIDMVRRPTGGLAVLHDHELTYSLTAPLAPFGGPRAAYTAINRALVEGLREAGVPAEQAAGGRSRGPVRDAAEPCFQAPAAGEVVVRGLKLIGSAQCCEHGAFLQHGSILLGGSQSRVRDLLAAGTQPPADPTSITLRDLLGAEPPLASLICALSAGFERLFGTRLARERLTRDENVTVGRLALHYAADDWTWRR